jgi:hypothetical protein
MLMNFSLMNLPDRFVVLTTAGRRSLPNLAQEWKSVALEAGFAVLVRFRC